MSAPAKPAPAPAATKTWRVTVHWDRSYQWQTVEAPDIITALKLAEPNLEYSLLDATKVVAWELED